MENIRKGGRPQGKHWEYYERSENTQDGHACATCKFCGFSLYRGECAKIEGHIANNCKKAPGYVIREYLQNVLILKILKKLLIFPLPLPLTLKKEN